MERFFVLRNLGEWIIKKDTRMINCHPDRVHAIAAAIDLADIEGKAGRDAEVLAKAEGEAFKTIWIYSKDLYPETLGKPNNTRARGTYRMNLNHSPTRVSMLIAQAAA